MYRIVNDLGENAYYLKVRFENVPSPKVYTGHCIIHWVGGDRSYALIGSYKSGGQWIISSDWVGESSVIKAVPLNSILNKIRKIRKVR